jgi:hypothetical protein
VPQANWHIRASIPAVSSAEAANPVDNGLFTTLLSEVKLWVGNAIFECCSASKTLAADLSWSASRMWEMEDQSVLKQIESRCDGIE